jgi:hypothetical protein
MGRPYPEPKLWTPKNPSKYKGDVNNIWIRSSWEKVLLKWMDSNPNVIEYSSEELKIPYISPIDNRYHNYYPDMIAKIKSKGKIITYVIEVKPFNQTFEPKVRKKMTKQYIHEVYTWGINSAKFKAAKDFCKKNGWIFRILTEKDLF